MTRSDDEILEFLLNEPNQPLRATPMVIQVNIEDFAISTIRGRLAKLLENGLVEYYDKDGALYQITSKGKMYLNGRLSESDL